MNINDYGAQDRYSAQLSNTNPVKAGLKKTQLNTSD